MSNRPRAVAPGNNHSVGVIAPASLPSSLDDLALGIGSLEQRGLPVKLYRDIADSKGYLAGSDDARAAELTAALHDPDTSLIFCARGGYGAIRILDQIDYKELAGHPKILVGYSDITALHLAILTHSGLPGISGPMVSVEWPQVDQRQEELLWQLLSGSASVDLGNPVAHPATTLVPGTATGPLIGGNMSIVRNLIGTGFLPDFAGAILFLEDLAEAPYRIDGMLAQFKYAGILDQIAALVVGGLTDWEPTEGKPTLTYREVIHDYTSELGIPVVMDFHYGHFAGSTPMPIGTAACLNATDGDVSLMTVEPVTVLPEVSA